MLRSNPRPAVTTNQESLHRLSRSTADGDIPQGSSSVHFNDPGLSYGSA